MGWIRLSGDGAGQPWCRGGGGRIKLRVIGWKQMLHYNPGVWIRMMMKERVLNLLWSGWTWIFSKDLLMWLWGDLINKFTPYLGSVQIKNVKTKKKKLKMSPHQLSRGWYCISLREVTQSLNFRGFSCLHRSIFFLKLNTKMLNI